MTRYFIVAIALICSIVVGASLASVASAGGGTRCGKVSATDNANNRARFKVKEYSVGCNRAESGVKRYYRQTNGEQGEQLKIQGYTCGPLQPYKVGEFAFQCRSDKSPAKRYKAFWVSH